MEEIVPYAHQEQPDYVDNLLPSYRFCPTDSELILYYLKPKIETGEHPKCRIYEVNLYSHSPEELTNQYRPCDDKWYFFTPRERKYEKGKVPNRRTGDFGYWKTTQKYTSVYHHYSATEPRVVGTRRSLDYRDEKGCKTAWLMQEYATNHPNLPIGSGQDGNKVLTDWVLCKIYKKKSSNETAEKTIAQAPPPPQVFASELPLTNSTGDQYQQNHFMSTPTNSAQIPHGATTSTSNYPHVYAAQSRANYTSPISDHIFQQMYHSMSTATNSTPAESLASAQPRANYTSPVSGHTFQQMYHSMSTPTNSAQIPHGATASTSNYPHIYATQSCANYTSPVSDHTFQQMYDSMPTATNSTPAESLASAQPFAYTTPVSLEDIAMNDWDDIFQQDGFSTTQSVVDKDILEFDDWISFEDFMSSEFDS
ncbi:putative transcription factor NAM family [Helianthus annuus]|nr:putative transcription factor NAM family [Helianthus annuus]